MFHSPGWVLGCAYTTCLSGLIKNFCTTPSGLPTPPICVYSSLILLLLLLFWEFFTPALANSFSLEFEWQQVSWTLLCILANLNVVVWMVSTCPLIFKSFSPCTTILWWLYQIHQLQLVLLSLFMFHSLLLFNYSTLFFLFLFFIFFQDKDV